jgi:DNA-binding MarR family transcriptional regulator
MTLSRAPLPSRPSSENAADVERGLRHFAGHCICGNVRMAARLLTAHYDAHLRPAGVEANQMALLWVIHASGRLPSNEVAHRAGIDQSTASRNLAVLGSRGWVQVAEAAEDRRRRMVSLTRAGRRALTRAYPLWQQAQAEAEAATADLANLGEIGRTLRKVTRRLQAGG